MSTPNLLEPLKRQLIPLGHQQTVKVSGLATRLAPRKIYLRKGNKIPRVAYESARYWLCAVLVGDNAPALFKPDSVSLETPYEDVAPSLLDELQNLSEYDPIALRVNAELQKTRAIRNSNLGCERRN
jgi:hypothetical protein